MRNYTAQTVDEYIQNSSPESRLKLQQLRSVIKSAVPQSQEGISWGIPFYKYHGLLAGFSVFKNHLSFGFTLPLELQDRQELEEQGYQTGQKTIQIRFDQEIPASIITQILQTRAKNNESQ
jgi:uncharacterized protein YdhG (YjbR/CyaY superfamily)